MTASFGRLQNETLRLQPGLNIIQAPNESGKSTWCAFLRCMLYGVDTAQRERAGQKPDKSLYAPWSGAPMAGTMDIQWQGKNIQLRRETRLPTAPMREFSAVYEGTGEPVRELTRADAGEVLTGVTAEVFRRTAFIQQGGLGVLPGPELEKKIASIVASGEEDVSFSEAAERLRTWQRKRRWRNKGRLPEVEAEIGEIDRQLSALETANRELSALETPAAELRRRRKQYLDQMSDERTSRREEALIRLEKAQERQRKLEETAVLRRREAAERRAVVENSVFAGKDPAQWRERVEADIAASEKRNSIKAPSGGWLIPVLFVLGCLLLAGGFMWLDALKPAGFILLGFTGVFGLLHARRRQKARPRGEDPLAAYGVSSGPELRQLLEKYAAAYRSVDAAQRLAQQVQQEADRAAKERQSVQEQVLSALGREGETAELLRETEQQLQTLREQHAAARARLETMGDKMVLTSRRRQLEEERQQLEREYRALELALNELDAANSQLQTGFSPLLARRTAHWMSALTGGRYSEVTLDRELSAMLRREGDMLPHETAFLSRGTCDQFYLALRLALCELVLPSEETCPIVLDDALVAFDDERMGYALTALQELGAARQILLFTCQEREKRYMEERQ